jgi:4-phospho-D-threonate 3-dehydrogenase / 4-phospho-D-erythronate 3-dehydrogenase
MVRNPDPIIGVTMGDPAGIGPEIILKSYNKKGIGGRHIIVIGDQRVMKAAYDLLKITSFRLNIVSEIKDCLFSRDVLNVLDLNLIVTGGFHHGKVQSLTGNAAFQCIKKAVDMALINEIDAIVTAPLNKEALQMAGHKYPGHTEIFASLTGTKDYAMLLYEKRLKVVHVSTHVSLLQAVRGLKKERIEIVIGLANSFMIKLGKDKPLIAVAGINPHAGENGLFGDEETREIIPAVKNMKAKGINVEGPFPPDTLFLQAIKGKYDIVVAMYHDQGHIPLKLIGFESGINVTLGLPFIRTSVDHGTAFEIAWKGIANEKSMTEAIKLSIKLSK